MENKKPKISVIIPTFNRILELKRAINSVLNQTYTDYEVLVINDSNIEKDVISFIGTLNNKKIQYFRNNRKKGPNGARNTGILNSIGDYIAFLDDDDEWLPEKLETQINEFKHHSPGIAASFCGYYFKFGKNWVKSHKINFEINIRKILLQKVMTCGGSTLLINKDYFKKTGLMNEELMRYEDIEILIRLLKFGKIISCNKKLVKVYGQNSKTNPDFVNKEFKKYIKIIKNDLKTISKEEQNHFYALKYRELALIYLINKRYSNMYKYLKKSISYKILSPIKYIRFILLTFQNISFIKFDNLWKRLQHIAIK